jgi:hypothetical protein
MAKYTETEARNPFLGGLYSVKTKNRQSVIANGGVVDVVDTKTGEVQTGFNMVSRMRLFDAEGFIKLYPAGLVVFGGLSARAQKVLLYFLSELKYEDTVYFVLNRCKSYTGYTDKSHIYKAISELKDREVIAPSDKPKYFFINPLMFYRGDRLKLIRE